MNSMTTVLRPTARARRKTRGEYIAAATKMITKMLVPKIDRISRAKIRRELT